MSKRLPSTIHLRLPKPNNNTVQLVEAIKSGHTLYTKVLIDIFSPQTLGQQTEWGQTALHVAAVYNNLDICKKLIIKMEPAALNITDNDGYTALHCAALKGMKDVCELLIPRMSSEAVNACDINYNQTALHYAAYEGHPEICKMLIGSMSPEALNTITKGPEGLFSSGKTALYWAAWNNLTEVCDLLVRKMNYLAVHDTIDVCNRKGLTSMSRLIKASMNKIEEDTTVTMIEHIDVEYDPLTVPVTPNVLGDIKSDADSHD